MGEQGVKVHVPARPQRNHGVVDRRVRVAGARDLQIGDAGALVLAVAQHLIQRQLVAVAQREAVCGPVFVRALQPDDRAGGEAETGGAEQADGGGQAGDLLVRHADDRARGEEADAAIASSRRNRTEP